MGGGQKVKRIVYLSVGMGLSTLFLNLLIHFTLGIQAPLGNCLLFLASFAFGIIGAIFSVATGVLPQALIQADYLEGLRMLTLCVVAAYLGTKHPRFSGAALVGATWLFILAPLCLTLGSLVPGQEHWTLEYLLLTASSDLVFSGLAMLLFMHPYIWSNLTTEPRRASVFSLMAHLFCVIGLGAFLLSLTLPNNVTNPQSINAFYGGAFLSLAVIVLAIVSGSVFLAHFVSEFIIEGNGKILQGARAGRFALPISQSIRVSSALQEQVPLEPVASGWLSSRDQSSEYQSGDGSGILVVHENKHVMFVNKQFCELFATDAELFLDKMYSASPLLPELVEFVDKCLVDDQRPFPRKVEIKVNQLPTSLRFFDVSVYSGDDQKSKWGNFGAEALIFSIRDITDRRTVESHLLQAQKLNSLGVAVGGLAHAFNNALTTITGQASFAKRSNDPRLISEALNGILDSSRKASELVWTLLEFSEGKPDLMEKRDLTQILDDRFDLLSKLVGETHQLHLKHTERHLGVVCDPNLLTQALASLVINSKESYASNAGEIEIAVDLEEIFPETAHLMPGSRAGKFARITVRDSGCGMNPEVLSKAFEPLFTTKQSSGHSGLGLSIVYAVIRAHDGFLTAESHPDRGTTISLYLPQVELESQTENNSSSLNDSQADISNSINNESVLVVEDEESVREMVGKMLETLGYDVRCAATVQEAVDMCEYRKFDLLLVDMMMPKMDGLELLSNLKQSQSSAKALIMTGYGATHNLQDIAQGVLTKPFDMDTLALMVKQALH